MTQQKADHYGETRCALEFYASGGVPSEAALAKATQIDDWFVVYTDAPAWHGMRRVMAIEGQMFSEAHPTRIDASTGPVLWLDRKLRFAYCAGTLYRLLKRH